MVFDIAIAAMGIFPFYLGFFFLMNREHPERVGKYLRIFFLGGLTTLPFFTMKLLGVDKTFLNSVFGPLFAIVLLAFAEEIAKSFALLFRRDWKHHYHYPIMIGLGFAFFENIAYLFGFEFTLSFLIIASVRLFTGSTAHAVFTTLVVHIMRKAQHRSKTLYYFAGILMAGTFHSFFNLLHHWEMSYLTIPLLILLITYVHFDAPLHSALSLARRHPHSLTPSTSMSR